MGPHEPYWRTNTSFSPPAPRWDFQFEYEGNSFGFQEGSHLYGSSTSSNSRESRSWLRGNYLPNIWHSASDEFGEFFSSPSDLSPAHQWTPPVIQEISLNEYANSSKRVLRPLYFSPTSEGLSAPHDAISSNSDGSDSETMANSLSSHLNFSGCHCFMSKPVHPVAFPVERNIPKFQDFNGTLDTHRFSTASCSFESSDVSEPTRSGCLNGSEGDKCGLCERFLSQRSPWSSRQIIKSGDMPVTGVLSCHHVFHVECLDQTTHKTQKGDPPCPICAKDYPHQRVLSKLQNGFSRLGPFREDGPSRPCGFTQGAPSSRNAMLLLNRNRTKCMSLKGNSGKELAGKMKKSGTCSPPSGGADGVGSSKSTSGSRKKS